MTDKVVPAIEAEEPIGGYDVVFVNIMNVPDNITCTICHLVLKAPVQAVPCGHRFCRTCIELFHARR